MSTSGPPPLAGRAVRAARRARVGSAAGTAITVTGNASFAEGAKLKLRLTDIAQAEGTYTVISAGSLTGAGDLDSDVALVPFMYDALLAVDQAAGLVNVDIARKATEELGLNRAQASAYDAVYAALADDDDVAGVFLGITEKNAFRAAVAQTLPDHAGGAFDGISLGIRTFARRLANPDGPLEREEKLSILFDAAAWDSSKDEGETAGRSSSVSPATESLDCGETVNLRGEMTRKRSPEAVFLPANCRPYQEATPV